MKSWTTDRGGHQPPQMYLDGLMTARPYVLVEPLQLQHRPPTSVELNFVQAASQLPTVVVEHVEQRLSVVAKYRHRPRASELELAPRWCSSESPSPASSAAALGRQLRLSRS